MIKYFSAIIFFFSILFQLHADDLAQKMSEPKSLQKIRILLKKNATEGLLEVKGPYFVEDPNTQYRLSSTLFGKRFLVRPVPDGIKWGEAYPGIHQITVTPKNPSDKILLDGIQYDGSITIYKVGSKLNIINELPIENFLKATLSFQFLFPQEEEVLASAAIAARSTAYFYACKDTESYWHLTKEEANYHGSALIIPDAPIVKAIDATKNMILVTSQEGKKCPFAAAWTEHSAGKTIPFHVMFRKDYLAPKMTVQAPHAAQDRSEAKWTYKTSKTELAKKLNVKQIKAIETYVDCSSNKVYALRIQDDVKSHVDIPFVDFQKLLGSDNIQSSEFSISGKLLDLTFTGYGKGLGVGLCLYSAGAMAQNGDTAVVILNKFFPDSELTNLSPKAVR